MEKFASNSVHGRQWYAAFLHWRAREYPARDIPDQVLDLWSEPEQDLRNKLISGEVFLVGFDAMGSKHIPEKEWCAVTQLDAMDDSAETSTLRLQDVRVYSVEAARPEPPKTAPEPNIKSKGTAPGTLLAIRAISALIHLEGPEPRKAASLAARAAAKAQELALQGADALNPQGSAMRDIAKAFLEGIAAADKD